MSSLLDLGGRTGTSFTETFESEDDISSANQILPSKSADSKIGESYWSEILAKNLESTAAVLLL